MRRFNFLNAFVLLNHFIHCVEINNTLNDFKHSNELFGFVKYGNWCGPQHGGYQDCCNNGPCSECDLKKGTPTLECFKQCPPTDYMDYYCAAHDECCLNNTKDITCFPEGNKCYCDCLLIDGVTKSNCVSDECSYYKSRLLSLFNYGLSCWYKNENNISVCNILSLRDYSITQFCDNGNEVNPWSRNLHSRNI
jgi:hypothetical protein